MRLTMRPSRLTGSFGYGATSVGRGLSHNQPAVEAAVTTDTDCESESTTPRSPQGAPQ